MDANKILYDYIVEQYGNVVDFSAKSGISHIELNAVLLKDNVPKEICIGLNLCRILNIDVNEIIFNSKIKECKYEKNIISSAKNGEIDKAAAATLKSEIYNRCMRLSEIEKKKVLEYINDILNKKEKI